MHDQSEFQCDPFLDFRIDPPNRSDTDFGHSKFLQCDNLVFHAIRHLENRPIIGPSERREREITSLGNSRFHRGRIERY
jgi:hypothetical protein